MVKRSRMLQSPSLGEISAIDCIQTVDATTDWGCKLAMSPPPPPPPSPPVAAAEEMKGLKKTAAVSDLGGEVSAFWQLGTRDSGEKPLVESGKRRKEGFLMIGGQCEGVERRWKGFGEFLKSCFMCKKGIGQRDDAFMYGNLLAFCSPFCRAKQMKLDEEKGKAATQTSRTNKNESSRKTGKIKSPKTPKGRKVQVRPSSSIVDK